MLSPILGYAEIILAGMHENNPLFDNVSQIKTAAENARTLTHELLAFSRKQVLEMKVVDLAEVVASYGKMLRRTIREDIAIQIRQNISKGAVRVDVSQMGQILMNLAVNAQDAMSHGGTIIIEINDIIVDEPHTLSSQDMGPGEYVAMTFSDTGSGMNAKIMEHIFEPFFTTKERGKGTGLGLSTVYGIVRQHGGYIVVYSEIGIGTTFKIYLPRVDGIPENLVTSKVITKFKEGTETVVIAEDNEGVRELTLDILTKSGYYVLTASNTDELLQTIQEYDGSIDLLLTDVIMPGMNGPELYERLRDSYPSLKVIYMSGYTDDVIAHHGILEEGFDFIQKPFSINILTDKLRKVLDG
jgi:CheY-like chemotaxis protein